jgi:cytochrome b6-f complex iron-sulfur subunit
MSRHENKPEVDIARRRFFQALGTGACALVAGGASALGLEFLSPRVLFEPATKFALGSPDAIDLGTVITDESHHVYVARFQDGFRALSSVCTHLGCITRYRPDEKTIACPCHGSRFDLAGEVLNGPAPRPLRWLEMELSSRGLITVDTAVEVPQGTVYKL